MNTVKTVSGIAVRTRAALALVERHREEFDQLHGDMRVAAGLSRWPLKAGETNPIVRLERLRKRMDDMREKEKVLLDLISGK